MEPVFSLDRDALASALDEQLTDYSLESHDEWRLDSFAEGTGAIRELANYAFDEWGCLKQRDELSYEIAVYELRSETENSLLITVRDAKCLTVQLSSLTVDADRLGDNQWEDQGMAVLAEVLESIIRTANCVLEEAQGFPFPGGE